jgi:tetratricopeptide (TPR) repeat protein
VGFVKHPAPPVGTVLGERYRVVRLLGAGAYGSVLEVEHVHTRHHRAMKLLHPEASENPETIERFLRESSAAGRIGNPHIVETFDAGRFPDGEPYLVMELLEGETVRALLRRERQLTVGLACELVAQAAEGIHAAHLAGIVHRDLKPDNLFLTAGQSLKILDFGVSRFSESDDTTLTQSRTAMGTPVYMSPEIFQGAKDATPAADTYALGVMLYELLCGVVPFEAPTYGALAIAVATTEARKLSERVLELDAKLEAIVARAMARKAGDRFESAQAFAEALRPYRSLEKQSVLPQTEPMPVPADVDSATYRPADRATPFEKASPYNEQLAEPVGPGRTLAVIGVLGVTLLGVGAWWLNSGPSESAVQADSAAPTNGGVTLIRSVRKEDWRASLAAEVLHRSLTLTGARLTPLADTETFLASQEEWPDGFLRPPVRERLSAAFGPTAVVTVDVSNGNLKLSIYGGSADKKQLSQQVTADDVTAAALVLAPQLRSLLGLPPGSPVDERGLAAALPHAAAEQYQHGLEQLRLMNLREAREFLEQAEKLDPKSALVQSALARVYDISGHDVLALAAAQKGVELAASGAPRTVELQLECQVAALSFVRQDVDTACGGLVATYPESVEFKLEYGEALKRTEQWPNAEEVLRSAPQDDPRVLISLNEVLSQEGRFEEERLVATRAIELAKARRAPWLTAAASLQRCDALRGKGELAAAYAECETARRLFVVPKDYEGQARAVTAQGHVISAATGLDGGVGDGASASDSYSRAVELAQKAGSVRDEIAAMKHLSDVMLADGHVADARKELEQALVKATESKSANGQSLVTQALGALEESVGRLDVSRAYFLKSVETGRASHLKPREQLALAGLGSIEWELGLLTDARGHLEKAIALASELNDRDAEEYALETIADVWSELGEPQRAKDALALARPKLKGRDADMARLELAELRHDLEAGLPIDRAWAATLIENAAGCEVPIAMVTEWLADPSQTAMAPKVNGALGQCDMPRDLEWLKVAMAQAWLEAGRPADAKKAVAGVVAEAKTKGWKNLELAGLLVEARIAKKPEDAAGVAAIATKLGHVAIARRARGEKAIVADAGH